MAIKSQGTTIHISVEDADVTAYSTATFDKIGEVHDIGEPSGEAADIEVTHLESAAKEFLVGLPDNGTIGISGNFVPTDVGQAMLQTALDTQIRHWIKITWTNGTVWHIKALVKKYAASASVDGKVPFTASFRTSGAWTRV